MSIGTVLRQMMTEDDGNSVFDFWRVGPALAMLVFLGCTIYIVIMTLKFDYLSFGAGCGSIMGLSGAGSLMKARGGQ